jgi:Ca-activated chloride channel family protein
MRADFVLDYDVLTVQQPHKLYLVARLTAGAAPDDRQRRPLNISVVIDRSGSMAGDKLDFTRQAAQFLVQNLSTRDVLSIVLYNDHVETLLAPEHVHHKDAINHRIANIKASGTTNLSGGWLEGCNHVARNLNEDFLNRVILMTDGLANRGVIEPDKLVTMAKQKHEIGISTTAMGLGSDFNEDLLIAIANAGGGAFYFIESPEVTPLIFQEELRGLLSVIGQNLVISMELTEYVTQVAQLHAYPTSTEGKQVSFRLGDVFGEEVKTLALELSIPAVQESGEKQIAVLRFDYDELTMNGVEHRVFEHPVIINIAPEGAQPILANPDVSQSVLLLKAAQARREAIQQADQGNYHHASQLLRRAAEMIQQSQLNNEELQDEVNALLKQADDMDRGSEAYSDFSRKMMSTQAIYTMTDRHGSTQAMRVRELERLLKEHEGEGGAAAKPEKKDPGIPPTSVLWNGNRFDLGGDLIRIGRAPQNEIVIKVNGVSRFHCQIKRENGRLMIEDVGSTNGTVIDGQLIHEPYPLSAGDEVYICNEKLSFQAEEAR